MTSPATTILTRPRARAIPPDARVLIYRRVSTLEQGRRDAVSLDAKERACREIAAQRGLTVDCVLTDMESGRRVSRPAFHALLRHCEADPSHLPVSPFGSATSPDRPIEATVLQRFAHVGRLDGVALGQIRDGPRDLEHAVIRPRRQLQPPDRRLEQQSLTRQ